MVQKKTLIYIVILIATTIAVFANSLGNGFVWDDLLYTVDNPIYRSFDLKAMLTSLGNGLEYLPVRDFSYALDFALGKGAPLVFHVHNLLIYAGIVVLVYFYSVRCFLSLNESCSEKAVHDTAFAGFITALLFAVHPIHSETVSFITCRNALLSTFFFFAAAISFLKSTVDVSSAVSWRYYGFSLLLFLLSLFSKANSIILPFVLLLHARMLPSAQRRNAALLTMPFFVLALSAFVFMTRIAARTTIINDRIEDWTFNGMLTKVVKAVQIIPFYLGKLAVPRNFSVAYDYVFAWSVYSPVVIWCAAGIVLLCTALFLLRRYFPAGPFAACWYLIALLPVLNFFATKPVVADRYALLPSFAFFFVIAALLYKIPLRFRKQGIIMVSVPLVIWWGTVAYGRNRVWFSEETLWTATVATSPGSQVGYRNLGNVYYLRGDNQKALKYFVVVADSDPSYHFILGVEAFQKRDLVSARSYLMQSLARQMNFIPSLYYLGLVYDQSGEKELAVSMFQQVLKSYQPDKGGMKELAQRYLQQSTLQ